MPKSARVVLIPVLAVVACALALFFFLSENRESIKKPPAGAGSQAGAATPVDSRPKRTVTLLFLSEDSESLVPEDREIVADGAPVVEARRIVAELIKGSQTGLLSAIPPETKLIQVYLDKEGTAFVDLSREFADRHPSGSSAEIATVYAVVDSLALNLKSVKKVFLLIDGEEKETLAGHIAIDHPILPDLTLIAGRQ